MSSDVDDDGCWELKASGDLSMMNIMLLCFLADDTSAFKRH